MTTTKLLRNMTVDELLAERATLEAYAAAPSVAYDDLLQSIKAIDTELARREEAKSWQS